MHKTLLPKQIGDTHLRLLRIYKAIVDCHGFAGAEIELNISRPAISQALSDLEGILNMRLCSRGRVGFAITEQGNKVYQATLNLLANIEDFRTEMNAINCELRGELNIGIIDNLVTIPEMKITKALALLKSKGKDIRINISMLPPDKIEAGVLDGHLHIGVIPEYKTLAGLNYNKLYQEKSLLYCSNEHPVFTQNENILREIKLEQLDAVINSRPSSKEMADAQAKLLNSASSNGREGVAFLILSGTYIGYLPMHYAKKWQDINVLKSIQSDKYFYHTYFNTIHRKGARENVVL